MAVERPAGYDPAASDPMSATPAVEEQIEVSEEMIENPDGSVTFGEEAVAEEQVPFGANLAEILDDDILQNISSDLQQQFEDDKASRDDWYHSYTQGLDLLGFKHQERSQPFQGASSVTHPLLAEAVTQFQAQAYKELLPSGGPVKCNVVGKMDVQVEEQSQRVKEYMNYLIMDEMEEYDADTDQLLFYLPLAGSAFKKIYYDAGLARPVSKFIPSEDLIVPYLATDLASAERVTHVIKMTPNEVRKAQVAGLYKDIELQDPVMDQNRIQEKYNQLEGVSRVNYDELYEILEIHCDLDIEGFEDKDEQSGEETGIKIPYVVTLDESSGKILSIYRNYREDDPLRKKIPYFVHYKFLPGLGFYGFGLIHILGGLSRAATSTLRQLVDAGTLSNLPAGFKARGIRIADDDTPLQPGEFRDIDAPSGDLRQGLMPLPYKGPDQTLFALLGYVVDAGKRFAAVADQKMGEGSQANPVGTTMAIIEQGSKIMSAIHKRLHYAQKKEFRILARIITDYLPPQYPYAVVGGNQMIKQTDFDDRVDIIPVSDPNIFSMSQRITLAQTQLQLAQANPQIHNQYEAYRRMYQSMGVQNIEALLPPPPQPQPTDAAMENSSMLLQKPAMAFPQQDHTAHIDTHRAFMSTYLVKNSPPVLSLIQAHISNHISELAKEEIMVRNQQEIQQQTAQYGGQLPPELQQQFEIETAKQVSVRIKELTEEMVAEEQEYLEGMQKDPLVTLKQEELGLRAEELELRAHKDGEKQALEEEKVEIDARQEQEKIDNTDRHATIREEIQLKKIDEPSKLRNKY
jgi:hypothetical protein